MWKRGTNVCRTTSVTGDASLRTAARGKKLLPVLLDEVSTCVKPLACLCTSAARFSACACENAAWSAHSTWCTPAMPAACLATAPHPAPATSTVTSPPILPAAVTTERVDSNNLLLSWSAMISERLEKRRAECAERAAKRASILDERRKSVVWPCPPSGAGEAAALNQECNQPAVSAGDRHSATRFSFLGSFNATLISYCQSIHQALNFSRIRNCSLRRFGIAR